MSQKKSSDIDLHAPQRQSYVAILIIIYKLTQATIRQSLPAIIVILIGGSMKKVGVIAIFIVVLGVVLSIYSIISFYKYYFYIKDDKLVVHKGVLKKTVLEIPFDRIQSINNEQNLIHRIFSVIKLNVDTAGSAKEEVQLYAIKEDVADHLREYILNNKKVSVESNEIIEIETSDKQSEEKEKIFSLSVLQLLKVGITANHLRSFGLILFFFFSVSDDLEEIGLDILSKAEEYLPVAQVILQSVFMIFFLGVLFLGVSFIVSVVSTILKYYGLTMYRIGDGFIIESGLLNRKQHAAKDSKIQILSWSQNLLERIAGIYTVIMQQASSVSAGNIKNARAAGLSYNDVSSVSRYIFEENYSELASIDWKSINSYYAYKLIVRWTWILVIPILVSFLDNNYKPLLFVVPIYIIIIWSCILRYRKKQYGLSDHLIAVRGGAFGHELSLMELHKVQNIKITQTPFQRRRKLSSISIHTASTTLYIPEIYTEESLALKDYLLYKVESSDKPWM